MAEPEGRGQADNAAVGALTRLHPLLHKDNSNFSNHCFTANFSGAEFFLSDHVVLGQRLLPGVACLEMARAAVSLLAGEFSDKRQSIRLQNVIWARPLHVGESGRRVNISLRRNGDRRVRFEISAGVQSGGSEAQGPPDAAPRIEGTQNPADAGRILYCQGFGLFEALEEAPHLDIASLKESVHQWEKTPAECYAAFEETGVNYGPSHRGVRAIYVGNGQVLAELLLPSSLKGTLEEFVLHPCLMDSALQACIGLPGVSLNAAPLLPFALDEIEIRGACAPAMWAWVRPSLGSGNADKLQKIDIELCDEAGSVRVRLRGFSLRRLETRNAAESGRGKQSLHPLIHKQPERGEKPRFITEFTGNETLFTDHLQVLPATACLEMVRAAGNLTGSGDVVALKQIVWADPLTVADAFCKVTTALNPSEDHYAFEICTADVAGRKRVHCQGKLIFARNSEESNADLGSLEIDTVQSRCRSALTAADCNQLLQGSHGRSLMSVETLRHNDNEAIAELRLPNHRDPGEAGYKLHPAILNGALLSSVILTLTGNAQAGLPTPFSLEELRIRGETSEVVYAHVRKSPDQAESGSGIFKHDVDLADRLGKIIVSFVGLTTMATRNRAAQGPPDPVPINGRTHPASRGSAAITWATSSIDKGIIYATARWVEEPLSETRSPGLRSPVPHFVLVEENDLLATTLQKRWPGAQVDILHQKGRNKAETIVGNFLQVFHRVRSWIENQSKIPQVMMVLVPESEEAYIHSALSGLIRTARLESSKISGKLIRYPRLNNDIPNFLVQRLEAELKDAGDLVEVRYDWGGRRAVRKYCEIYRESPDENTRPAFVPGDVVWITGGLGKLGRIFARHLGSCKALSIVLSGRSALDGTRAEVLEELRREGADLEYFPCDVSQVDQVMSLVRSILERYGKLTGVIHCAGIIQDSFIHRKTPEEIRSVFAPKVGGLLAIDEAVRNVDLSFLVLFSAAAGAFGNPGQADYAGANAFLDGFAEYRNGLVDRKECSGRTVSLIWPLWRDGGMQLDHRTAKLMNQRTGMAALETEQGTESFDFALWGRKHPQVLVAAGCAERIREKLLNSVRVGNREWNSGSGNQTSGDENKHYVFPLEGSSSNTDSFSRRTAADPARQDRTGIGIVPVRIRFHQLH